MKYVCFKLTKDEVVKFQCPVGYLACYGTQLPYMSSCVAYSPKLKVSGLVGLH